MPFDKSRIQGIGSDGSVTTATSKATSCPQGHALRLWAARPGWCDQCGRKVTKGEQVMDCRACNWYLCNLCRPVDQDESSIWGAISSMADQVGGPGLTSALDNFSLQVGDIMQATQEEISEMGADIKSFVNSAMGLEDSDEETGGASAVAEPRPADSSTLVQRQEAIGTINSFCENYPAYRVVPKPEELEALLAVCEKMNASALASAMYEQLSFSSGEVEWQPRLRCLHLLEFCYAKGGGHRAIASSVGQQGEALIKHLSEVSQCRDKAIKVYILLLGQAAAQEAGLPVPTRAEEEAVTTAAVRAKATAAAAAARPKGAAPDLLDLADGLSDAFKSEQPKARAPAKVPAKAKATAAPADLLDCFDEPAPPPPSSSLVPDLDLLNPAAFSAPSAAAAPVFGAGIVPDLTFLTTLPTNAPAAAVPDLFANFGGSTGASSSASAANGGVQSAQAKIAAVFAAQPSPPRCFAALSQAAPYPATGPPAPSLAAAFSGAFVGAGRGGSTNHGVSAPWAMPMFSPALPTPPAAGRGGYVIPKVAELSPSEKTKDPFDFVTQHTGLGGAK